MSKEPEIIQAIRFVCEEKGLSQEVVIATIEAALAAAYRKDFGQPTQNIEVVLNRDNGIYQVYDIKTVVPDFTEAEIEAQHEEMRELKEKAKEARLAGEEAPAESEKLFYNPKLHLMISEAKKIKDDAELNETMKIDLLLPAEFGRMAAQTAKQVVMQKLREAERNTVYDEYKSKEGEIVIGVVQRREGRNMLIDLGRTVGVMPPDQQVNSEKYRTGQRLKVYVVAVQMGGRGAQIILSRSHINIVKQLFTTEIPEIGNGVIEIKSIAREAGSRSKVAVKSNDENIDPIGSCVGQRGTRVQTIINELGGEKVDIIEYSDDPIVFITHALSPAKVISMELNADRKEAKVIVAEDQLSLAIGKGGQNVRLASQLTNWTINIAGKEVAATAVEEVKKEEAKVEEVAPVVEEAKKEEPISEETK